MYKRQAVPQPNRRTKARSRTKFTTTAAARAYSGRFASPWALSLIHISRTTGYRVVFYAARSATLVLAYLWVPWMVIILLVFYLVKREMPYDLIP